MRYTVLFYVAALVVLGAGDFARSQSNRRERQDPELIVESGGRLAYCDQMLFTPDGKWVLTVGDDKVVRLWACADCKLDPLSMRVLRWNIWREQRGTIYSLAVSADPEGRYVAVGGVGELTTTVAVLDRTTGETVHSVVALQDTDTGEMIPFGTPLKERKLRNLFAVMSVAFDASGKRLAFGTADGSVFVWDFKTIRPLGRHDPAFGGNLPANTPLLKDGFNRVRLVRFLSDDRVLSVAESSEVVEWDLTEKPATRAREWVVGRGHSVRVATLSRDNRWLAFGLKGPVLAVRSLDGTRRNDVELEKGQFPRSVAFDAESKRLAAGFGVLATDSPYYIDTNDYVRLFDVGDAITTKLTLKHTGRAESVAFHPGGGLLAVAGGNDHEVSLWDLAKTDAPVSVLRGAGNCLWDVGLSRDGNVLGFKDRRNAATLNPNDRGQGTWRAFNLPRRRWVSGDEFTPVPRLDTVAGWTVRPDKTDPHTWYAVEKNGDEYQLEYDGQRDGMPRCYTFIEADADNPARLAVGHYWGLSIYELYAGKKPKRVRLCVGHQGEVTALGLSADRTWLVSCSNDQTIAAWSLSNRWPSQPILGAAFEPRGAKLRVTAVDAGSPAWEAGLLVGDEIVLFAFGGKPLAGGPAAWHARLLDPVPGTEHFFRVVRDGKTVDMLTTARQRPLWRFFPTRDGEWVLWMWRNSFYDTSTRGDFAIGWHINSPEAGQTPRFYRAEQFRKIYQKRTVIDKLLQTRDVRTALSLLGDNPLPVRFDETEPPAVALALTPTANGWEATLTATPHGENPDLQPRDGELWINDFRLQAWANVDAWEKVGRVYTRKVLLPVELLRADENVVTFQTSNRLGGRAEATTTVKNPKSAPAKMRAIGVAVGVNNYGASKQARDLGALGNLTSAVGDATSIKAAIEGQKYFGAADIELLPDDRAGRAEIEKALDDLARKAKPDDLCIIFLAGHGMFREEDAKDAKRSLFIFCTPHFQGDDPEKTGVTSEVLYRKLAAINCRKLVLLDACHSGEAASNPVRGLTPGGQGPVILAACDRNQHSYENPTFGHGLFTQSLLEALNEKFADADTDVNKILDTRELYNYTRTRLPQMLTKIGHNEFLQVPIMFAPQPKPLTVTGR